MTWAILIDGSIEYVDLHDHRSAERMAERLDVDDARVTIRPMNSIADRVTNSIEGGCQS